MAKKKKPTLKSNVNRGFATTSLPSKKEDSETTSNPNTNPTSSAISTKGNSTPADPVTASPSVDQKNHADQIIKAMNQAGSENRGRGNGETFDLSKVREQELQSLVDKLADKVDKEVAKTYKSIEFDRRLSKSLPAFVMDDKQLRDDILALAASSNSTSISSSNPTLNGISTNTSSNNVSGNVTPLEGKAGAFSSTLNPIQSTSKTLLDLVSSISLSESTSPSSISTSISPLTSSNATSFSEPEEKFLLKALTTHTLLRRLGFTRTQADVSIVGSGSLDLEDCLAYLTLILSQDELEAARKAADRGEIRRDVKERGPKNDEAEEKNEASSDQKSSEDKVVDEDDGMDSDEEPDETKPPSHPGYSFKRTTASRAALLSREAQIQEAKETREKEEMELNSTSTDEKPSNEVIQASTDEVKSVLSSISETISALDTLERPTPSWSSARVAQIQIDRLNSKRFKVLGKKWALKDVDRVSSQIGKIREELRSLLNDAERQPSFDRKIAEQLFRRDQLKKDDEEFEKRKLEEKREKELKEALEGKASLEDESLEGKVLTEEEKLKEEEEKEKKRKEILDPYGQGKHNSKNEIDLDPDMDGDSEEDDEPLFGDMLDETPTEVADVATGTTVQVKTLPTQAKGGGGGKTGRTLLSDALKRVDPYAQSKFESVSGGGRIYRSRLTLRWRAPGTSSVNENAKKGGFVDVYTLTSIGCVNQNQADDLLAIVALSCMDKDKPTHRSLGPGFREWYEEIDSLRKEEKDSRARKRIDRISTVLQSRVEEARERKGKSKGVQSSLNAKDGQADIGELARGVIKEAPENVKEKIRETFRIKVETQSYQDMLPQRQSLPIFKYRDHILSVLDSSQIFVLSGETGCGKSTQVPAYLLEHCLSKGEPCKIYVTEPRRISAISLAERVSAEMGEPKGAVGGNESLVGYAIRLESNVGRNAKLVYATTGIVLRMLEGTAFNEITHVIIDEVHERSIESDFLLIILKTLLQHRSDLKVILMSATVDAERISTYCGGCPTITVPGRTFPVEIRYMEDAVEMCDYTIEDGSPYARRPKRGQWNTKPDASNMAKLASTEDEEALRMEEDDDEEAEQGQRSSSTSLAKTRYNPKTISTLDRMDEFVINHDLIVKLLERICFSQDLEQYSAAILIFLPGLADIRKCHDLLTSHRSFGSNRFRVYPLHSTLTSESQASVFNVPPPGIRKIVIATNIAETGITIPDVTCVIDSGKQREMRFDEKKQISRLVEGFVAKSNAKQRRGRAGRVQEGLAFHLFTKFRHDQYFPDHPLPEMLRLSLQDLALKLKVMKIRIGTSIENALSLALDPPLAVNVQRAVSALVEVKALTANEEITPLGRHLSRLPLDVHMAKFLLIATLFKCLDPALTIAAALNSKSPFITPFGREAEADRSKASFKTGDSDFFSIANAFNAWRRAVGQNYGRQFCSKCFLSQQTLMQIEELRQQYMAYLLDSGFAQVDDETRKEMARNKFRAGSGKPRFMVTPPDLDINSNSMAILNVAISAGLYPKLLSIEPRSYQLKTIGNNQPVSIHPSSVNFRMRLSELPRGANHLVYFTIMSTKKLYAWETGAVDDRGVMVLCGEADWKMSSNSLYIDRQKIRMSIPDSKTLLALSILREQLTRLINTSFKNPGKPWTEEQQKFFVLAGKALGQGLNEKDQILQK